MKISKSEIQEVKHQDAAKEFLELFYPIHYAIGMQVEDALRGNGELDRHQTVIMWLLRSEGKNTRRPSLRRKDIERCLTSWYDITSSTVSKALRALAKPPHNYIVITEDPNSGREKLVTVTPAGQRYYKRMVDNASSFIQLATDRMSTEENSMGIHMFRVISETFQALRDEGQIELVKGENANKKRKPKPRVKSV
ncbi:MAG: MarR family winged helix-turn-helix transcriptional regulator [Oceanococcus sp.]